MIVPPVRHALLLIGGLLGSAGVGWADEPPARDADAALLAGAAARIEQHRKSDGVVVVRDAAGRPVPEAEVTIEQTRHAFLFGCNLFLWGRAGNPEAEAAYRDQFRELFNYATLPFYWFAYEPKPGRTDRERLERMAHWCRDQGIATKGHPLAWNYADPRWLPDDLDQIRALQMQRIDDIVGHFQGQIDRWDVVNEATEFDRQQFRRDAPKLTRMWEQTGKSEFVQQCFRHARQAGPQAQLVINDYRTDAAYERLLDTLRDAQGRPIFGAIGIQSHMHRETWRNEHIWDVCQRFARFGVPLHFTETTILSGQRGWELARDGKSWDSTEEGERAQADDVARFYTLLFSHPSVEAITWWDFADRGAWQRAPAGLVRTDLTPKPAYQRLHELIKGAWWTRRVALHTNREGEVSFRGFLGDYHVTVVAGGQRVVRDAQLVKGAANRWMVQLAPTSLERP